jgi:hypothetical protein
MAHLIAHLLCRAIEIVVGLGVLGFARAIEHMLTP